MTPSSFIVSYLYCVSSLPTVCHHYLLCVIITYCVSLPTVHVCHHFPEYVLLCVTITSTVCYHLWHCYPVCMYLSLASRLEGVLRLCYYQESMVDILGEGTSKSREAATGECCHGSNLCNIHYQLMEWQRHYSRLQSQDLSHKSLHP